MKPHKITVERYDTCIVPLLIRVKQLDGWYEYIPCGGDVITVNIKNKSNKILSTLIKHKQKIYTTTHTTRRK